MRDVVSFGAWVRSRRRALDLTQAALAARVACAEVTVRKIEADERRPSPVMATRLAQALEVEPTEQARFVQSARAVLAASRLPRPLTAARPLLLPVPVNSFVGREEEMERALSLLRAAGGRTRLMTVTGPPGVGKTRFAIELAALLAEKLDADAVFIPLAAETVPDRVTRRMAARLGCPTESGVDVESTLIASLRQGPTILVLDNFEHLAEAAKPVRDLLAQCPDLTCIVTSRVPLAIEDEFEFVLDGLHEAFELFEERARASSSSFDAVSERVAVESICSRLDHLPLAVELAARRIRWHSATEILAELTAGLGTLLRANAIDPRHRTILAAIRWSDDLLTSGARAALRAMAVAPTGISRRRLEVVCGHEPPIEELLDSSLVRVDGDRLIALHVVRAYAAEAARDEGLFDELQRRHARALLSEVEAGVPGLVTTNPRVVQTLENEVDNLDASVRWCLRDGSSEDDVALGVALVEAMGVWWVLRDRSAQGRELATLAGRRSGVGRPRLRYIEAETAWSVGQTEFARSQFLDLADTEDAEVAAAAMGALGLLAMIDGDLGTARELLERSGDLVDRDENPDLMAMMQLRAGLLAIHEGKLQDAQDRHLEALAIAEAHGNLWCIGTAVGNLADIALRSSRNDDAVAGYQRSIQTFVEGGSEWYAASRVEGLAAALAAGGAFAEAARMSGACAGWLAQLGLDRHPLVAVHEAWGDEVLRAELGDSPFEAEWQEGFAAGRAELVFALT